jgi:deoxyribodipyrimidine photo-lyase
MMQPSPSEQPNVNLVWFKRDLRLTDHAPLKAAIAQEKPLILLYCIEPMLLNDPHYSDRHWRFIWQSLSDLNTQLKPFGTRITVVQSDIIDCLDTLSQQLTINHIYSYEEIGLTNTFERDKAVKRWCIQQKIQWIEFPCGAVIRGAKNRDDWDHHWKKVMRSPVDTPDLAKLKSYDVEQMLLPECLLPDKWLIEHPEMQTGGPTQGWAVLDSFFQERGRVYHDWISKPLQSQESCSRLSPYLAFGNLSLREVYQSLLCHWKQPGWRKALSALASRLHWHCHFIQKFESETEMEFRPVNQAYQHYEYRDDSEVTTHLCAWLHGYTGYPLVDACMRCLHATGYINFRMRAMLVSFLCHHLNIDWRLGSAPLAALFLDFEPGIHYPQFQMQAGITGTNTIRIYNPTKQAEDHDPDGVFIAQWIPELSALPSMLRREPWKMTPMEEAMFDIQLGKDYPLPIIDIQITGPKARERLWSFRSRADVKAESRRIVDRHVRPER